MTRKWFAVVYSKLDEITPVEGANFFDAYCRASKPPYKTDGSGSIEALVYCDTSDDEIENLRCRRHALKVLVEYDRERQEDKKRGKKWDTTKSPLPKAHSDGINETAQKHVRRHEMSG